MYELRLDFTVESGHFIRECFKEGSSVLNNADNSPMVQSIL